MRLDDQRESSNVENRRDESGIGFGGGGQRAGGMGGGLGSLIGMALPFIGSRFGIVGIVVAIGAILLFNCMGSVQVAAPPSSPQVSASPAGAPEAPAPGCSASIRVGRTPI